MICLVNSVMTNHQAKFESIILAGERPEGSKLGHAFNVSASVMVPVAGKPALAHVIEAIKASPGVDCGIICGPTSVIVENDPDLRSVLRDSNHEWLEQASGPASSALLALEKSDHYPKLLTAGDHALLCSEIITDFCKQARNKACSKVSAEHGTESPDENSGYDFVIGLVPYELVRSAWPHSKRTVLKFSDGEYCGSNLFAIMNPQGRNALAFWQQAEADRKHPWKIARRFGVLALLRYFFRRLSLDATLRSLSGLAGCRIGFIQLDFARAAVDVDSVEDQQLAEQVLLSDT